MPGWVPGTYLLYPSYSEADTSYTWTAKKKKKNGNHRSFSSVGSRGRAAKLCGSAVKTHQLGHPSSHTGYLGSIPGSCPSFLLVQILGGRGDSLNCWVLATHLSPDEVLALGLGLAQPLPLQTCQQGGSSVS